MRLLIALVLAAASGPAIAAPLPREAANCPRTTSYLANQTSEYRGGPLKPRKLTELPPAVGYMAVYRRIGDCEAPLTMVEYRNTRRR